MCGRYVSPEEAAIVRFWHIGRHNQPKLFSSNFNVAPTMQVPIILLAADGAIELVSARWGLIPGWWKKPVPPSLTFNARSEEAAKKPTWRQSLKTTRCLMPARGWYEWNQTEHVRSESGRQVNQPYFIYSPNEEVVAFAAMWSIWQRPEAEPVMSCALLTKEAAPSIANIHQRMPVVLAPQQYSAWLASTTTAQEVGELIADSRQDFEGYRISTKVNNVRNNFPELLDEVLSGK
jgi:putative SOS response-associated peptidase YedK